MEYNFDLNILIYYSRTSYKLLFQRPHQIMTHYDNTWTKIFITNENIDEYNSKYNLYIISYINRKHIYKYLQNKNIVIYYTDPRRYNEIIGFKNNFPNTKILFDLIDAPLEEFTVWQKNLNSSVLDADFVTYSHPKLIEFLHNINIDKKYHYVSNGCDYNHFIQAKNKIYPKPIEIPETNKLILGYYGAFSHWIDWDIVKKYADENIYHIIMIGGIEGIKDYDIRFEHSNITWISHKPYEEIPLYLSWFDVCFLPFKDIELNKYVNPCKLWEYKITDKPIIKYNINVSEDDNDDNDDNNNEEIITYDIICEKIKNIIS